MQLSSVPHHCDRWIRSDLPWISSDGRRIGRRERVERNGANKENAGHIVAQEQARLGGSGVPSHDHMRFYGNCERHYGDVACGVKKRWCCISSCSHFRGAFQVRRCVWRGPREAKTETNLRRCDFGDDRRRISRREQKSALSQNGVEEATVQQSW